MHGLKWLKNRSVVIPGGGGSLGQALIGKLLSSSCKSIRVLDVSEKSLYEVKQRFHSPRLRLLLGDVRNPDRVATAMSGVDFVIVCAAVKSVDIASENIMETVETNVNGAFAIVREAYRSHPKRVLFLSSDKSILSGGPPGVYHATKFIVEELTRWANLHSESTRFSCIRPANFVPSDMSVFSTWYEYYRAGKQIPVTHPSATRYFIPLGEAAAFTLKALEVMKGGEIFVPPSQKFNMYKLATRLNRPIKIVGLRPSDRLAESLMNEDERRYARKVAGMWVINRG